MSRASANQPDYRLESRSTSFSEIPIIDVGTLIDGSNPMKVANEIGYILENVGFLYIKNHGVDKQLIKDVYTQAEAFFNLPLEQKQRLNIIHSGQTLRGYIPMYGEN
ncbi:MAG: isopenicillin N synthase-like dioxygenase, partial [Motiliproteus sp.]